MALQDQVVIVGAARTPIGAFRGKLAALSAPQLGAVAIGEAVRRSGVAPQWIDEVIMGTCLFAGQRQAPARQAARGAGLPKSAACTTVSKMCGSGMKATMLCHDMLLAGSSQMAVAGGMESMSNAPYMIRRAGTGSRMGHQQLFDHMFYDGLEDADEGRLMGSFACQFAGENCFSRDEQDSFALASLERARAACTDGSFNWEMAPVLVPSPSGDMPVEHDETPFTIREERIATLKPAFRPTGTVTAANSSSISDGAAALVLARESSAERLGLRPIARIVAHATYGGEMAAFPSAPVHAVASLCAKAGWPIDSVDLFEINEAFAVVALAAMKGLGIPHDKLNVNGGACALGHPVGATGARIIVTLLGALRKHRLTRGIASLCLGGGEATAVAIEMIPA